MSCDHVIAASFGDDGGGLLHASQRDTAAAGERQVLVRWLERANELLALPPPAAGPDERLVRALELEVATRPPCDEWFLARRWVFFNYCPNCGAQVRP